MVDAELANMVAGDTMTTPCATALGVGIVAASYVSVADEAKRFRNSDAHGLMHGIVSRGALTSLPSSPMTRAAPHACGRRPWRRVSS